jgi:hypothetical protein
MTEFSCRLSTIHVSKDEQRQLSPGSFMTLKIRGKQLQRSVECSAHDLQPVRAVKSHPTPTPYRAQACPPQVGLE